VLSWKKLVEGGAKRHGVYRQSSIVGELEDDHLEQVARCIGADHEDLRRVVVLVHVRDDDRVVDDMRDGLLVDAVAARSSVELHT
jgi:hypothetical protein